MQIVKPQRIALLYKPYEHLGQCHLAVTGMLYFPFPQPDYLLPEIAMWKMVAAEFGQDAVFDMCMPKPRAEALVMGKCYAPGGKPTGRSSVRLTIGDESRPLLEKRLNVFGDRHWRRGIAGMAPSEPAPFVEMPVDYAHAFGGAGYAQNPLGKGAAALPPAKDGTVVHPLPNVEAPKFPIVSPDDRPAPAGLGPLDIAWPQRAAKAGTYDGKWLKERFPAYADDMDTTIFNAASPDQWLAGFFAGDEPFSIAGMHPERAAVQGTLPGAAMRCFVRQRAADGIQLREVKMRAETLWMMPRVERAILVFRGVIGIATDDAEDVGALLIAAESMAAPRPVDYYRDVFDVRLDPREGALHMLRDEQLMPQLPARTAPFPEDSGPDDWLYLPKGHQRRRLLTKAGKDMDKVKVQVANARIKIVESQQKMLSQQEWLSRLPPGPQVEAKRLELAAAAEAITAQLAKIDEMLAFQLPPDPPPTHLEELPALKKKLVEEARVAMDDAKVKIAEAEQKVRVSIAEAGKRAGELRERAEKAGATPEQLKSLQAPMPDYDKLKLEARLNAGGPPKPFARATIDKLRAAGERVQGLNVSVPALAAGAPAQATPGVQQQVDAAKAQAARALQDKLPQLEKQLTDGERQIHQMYRKNAHMMLPARPLGPDANAAVRQSVVAAHASGQSLAGSDYSGADLSGLALKGIDLHDALLEGVNFSGADLSGADLSGAVLARADFGKARLMGAKLVGANLGFADLRGANVTGGADLSGATLANASMEQSDFTGAKLDKADLLGAKLAGANLSKVSAPDTNFINVDLRTPDEPPPMDIEPQPSPDLDMRGAKFAGANLEKARFVNCIVEDIDFSGANLAGALFLAAKGDRCVFRGANMTNARFVMASSFADCDFSGAMLDKGNLRGTNLANGKFIGCSAQYADFTDAKLGRAQFAKVLARGARFTKADLTLAHMEGANLMEGVLQKAVLHGTRLAGANLYRADLLRIKVDNGTDLSRANLGSTLAGAADKK